MKNKLIIDWRIFAITVSIVVTLAEILSYTTGASWWVTLLAVVIGWVLNALIIEWEDNQPGGWNNPRPPPDDEC